MAPYEALYGRKCRSPIFLNEAGERRVLDPVAVPWIEDAYEKVEVIRQRLQIAQSRQKSYADNRRKDLEFEVGDKYHLDPTHVLKPKEIDIDVSLTYEEKPVRILDRKVKELRTKQITLVKVLWRNHKVEKAILGSGRGHSNQVP
ncbi:uncharacterized protein [Coffea arabica]|uniref:Reverse transcriptase domain-containing protein n=1 Tax=Coffea arabica TaxID=13443 RepID=A0ABM4U1E4_COFAR